MIELCLLAFALAMDSFAVSIWLWVKNKKANILLILKIAFFFWFFQWFMPLIWYLLNIWIGDFISSIDHWIAFILLSFIWWKMLYESFEISESTEEIKLITNKVLLILAIATSIDAMAAWFTLNLLSINPFISILAIWVITFLLSIVWVFIWKKWWDFLEDKAEKLGWIILILLWIKILVEHTFF